MMFDSHTRARPTLSSRHIDPDPDVVVIGGGPAGSAAARMLALLGYEVLVLAGGSRRRASLAESLPPSCRRPLAALGMLEAVMEAGFLHTRGNSSSWLDADLRPADFGGDNGFQVVRDDLDRVLLESAASAGARVLPDGYVSGVRRDPLPVVRWRTETDEGIARPQWVLDCSGRTGVVARQGLRVPTEGPSTIALVGIWRRSGGWSLPDPSHTVVEAYEGGWCWSVPVAGDLRYVAVMLDPAITASSRGRGASGTYLRELENTRHLSRLLAGATLQARPSGCDATPYAARRAGGGDFLLVGDAASFIDPLSSFGVKKALSFGWLAAIVVNTVRRDPGMRSAALEFYEERESEAQRAYTEQARRQYAIGAERFDTPFWRARVIGDGGFESAAFGAADHGAAVTGLEDQEGSDSVWRTYGPTRTARAPELREAFEAIREASPLRLRLHPEVRRVPRPTVEGQELVLRDHLVSPGAGGAIRFLDTVDLPALAEQFPGCVELPELYERYCTVSGHIELTRFMSGLAGMVALRLARVG